MRSPSVTFPYTRVIARPSLPFTSTPGGESRCSRPAPPGEDNIFEDFAYADTRDSYWRKIRNWFGHSYGLHSMEGIAELICRNFSAIAALYRDMLPALDKIVVAFENALAEETGAVL